MKRALITVLCLLAGSALADWRGAFDDYYFKPTASGAAAVTYVAGTGGDVTNTYYGDGTNGTSGVHYQVHIFSNSANFVVSAGGSIDALIVAGGGGAGSGTCGGGGGAGGCLYTTAVAVTAQSYAVVVGAGGAGAPTYSQIPEYGTNSTAFGLTAYGGGAGAKPYRNAGSNGGSGGGASSYDTAPGGGTGVTGQGNAGGNITINSWTWVGAGGGGWGEAGHDTPGAPIEFWSQGGDGKTNYITGIGIAYGGGGGGGCAYDVRGSTVPRAAIGGGGTGAKQGAGVNYEWGGNGTDGLGGGGGGSGGSVADPYHAGGNGGKGVVIVRYVIQ